MSSCKIARYEEYCDTDLIERALPDRIAAKSLPIGTLLTSNDVKLVAWPASSPVAGSFSTAEEVTERGLITPVAENEPITANKLAPKEAGAGLPPTITAGMRAISVKVNEVIGVAGFVVPGTRVDLVVTLSRRTGSRWLEWVSMESPSGTRFQRTSQGAKSRAVIRWRDFNRPHPEPLIPSLSRDEG